MSTSVEQPRALRLLSLDGGGCRGLSALLILQRVMQYIQTDNGLAEVPKPHEYFDLIAGASTGGLIALMLGRLQMSVDQCIQVYSKMSKDIFADSFRLLGRTGNALRGKPWFEASKLEEALRQVIREYAGHDEAPLVDPRERNPQCKVFVCAVFEKQTVPILIRSYASKDTARAVQQAKIWQAGRATSAAPVFFEPLRMGDLDSTFADGGLRNNNPVEELKKEARRIWPDDSQFPFGVLLSIGTGRQISKDLGSGIRPLVDALSRIATDSEATARRFADNNHEELVKKKRYFRFNAVGLENVSLEEWKKRPVIEAATERYCDERPVQEALEDCVRAVHGKFHNPEPGQDSILEQASIFHERVSEIPFFPATTFVNRDPLMQNIHRQLHSPKSKSSTSQILPIHGMGGVGKTQLSLWYASKFSKEYQIKIWIDATSEESMKSNFESIRRKHLNSIERALGVARSKDNAAATEVIAWLDHAKGEWLILFDNADEIDLKRIRNLFPNSIKGHVIVTTRQSNSARMSTLEGIEVLGTNDAESIDIFFKNAAIDTPTIRQRNAARRIAQELGNLPLAVELAGAYISRKPQLANDLERYLDVLASDREVILKNTPQHYLKDYGSSVITVWESSFSVIERSNKLAARLLTLFGLYDRLDIKPRVIYLFVSAWRTLSTESTDESAMNQSDGKSLMDYLELTTVDDLDEWMSTTYEDAVSEIESHHLVYYDIAPTQKIKSLHMHPLVHSWAIDRLSLEEKANTITMAVFMFAIASTRPTTSDNQLLAKHISYLANFLGHVDRSGGMKRPLELFHNVLVEQQRWKGIHAVAKYRFEDEENGDLIARAWMNYAQWGNADTEIVIETARSILDEWSQRVPLNKNEITNAQVDLARYLLNSPSSKENIDEAGGLLREANEYHLDTLGPEHWQTLRARAIYALYYCKIQNFNTAIDILTELVAVAERTIQYDLIQVLYFKRNLGYAYMEKIEARNPAPSLDRDWEDYTEAKSILSDVLSGCEELLGSDHELVLGVKEDLERLDTLMDDARDEYGGSVDGGSMRDGSMDIHDGRDVLRAGKRKRNIWRRIQTRLWRRP